MSRKRRDIDTSVKASKTPLILAGVLAVIVAHHYGIPIADLVSVIALLVGFHK